MDVTKSLNRNGDLTNHLKFVARQFLYVDILLASKRALSTLPHGGAIVRTICNCSSPPSARRAPGKATPHRHTPGHRIARRRLEVLNLCANNYLGLAQHPDVQHAASGTAPLGLGLASVIHLRHPKCPQTARAKAQRLLGTETPFLFLLLDATAGFRNTLGPEDAIISDELNHASIIDGIRSAKPNGIAIATTTSPTSGKAARLRQCPLSDDQNRRRILHGRLTCEPPASATSPTSTTRS